MFDHFALLASIYEWVFHPPDPSRLRELLRLPTDGRLLDAGGGTGRVSAQLASLTGGLVISDLSRPMLRQAIQKGGLYSVQAHAERLPFPAESFERVLVVDALHHFCNQQEAVDDLLRVLKPGGRLVIEEPDITRFAVKLVALAEKLALMGSHMHTACRIKGMIECHGLSVEIEKDDGFAVWIVADK